MKYLNLTGLAYFWEKIKTYVEGQITATSNNLQNDYNAKINTTNTNLATLTGTVTTNLNTARTYTDTKSASALAGAKAYTDDEVTDIVSLINSKTSAQNYQWIDYEAGNTHLLFTPYGCTIRLYATGVNLSAMTKNTTLFRLPSSITTYYEIPCSGAVLTSAGVATGTNFNAVIKSNRTIEVSASATVSGGVIRYDITIPKGAYTYG